MSADRYLLVCASVFWSSHLAQLFHEPLGAHSCRHGSSLLNRSSKIRVLLLGWKVEGFGDGDLGLVGIGKFQVD